MEQIKLKELPNRYIKSLEEKFKTELIEKYKLMGIDFNLSDIEIKQDFNEYFLNLIFFYDKFKMRYYFAEIKKLSY